MCGGVGGVRNVVVHDEVMGCFWDRVRVYKKCIRGVDKSHQQRERESYYTLFYE